MTLQWAAAHARALLSGDRKMWRLLPYLTWLKYRCIDVRGNTVAEVGLSPERSHRHSNSGGPYLAKVISSLHVTRIDAVLDLGCGKGGAMLTLSRAPFRRVDGVELCPMLAEVARKNLRKLGILHSTVYCCDAADFKDLNDYNYFYMYNPFPEIVMYRVLCNIQTSASEHKREITLIYKNPIYHDLVLQAGFQKSRIFEHDDTPFALYRM